MRNLNTRHLNWPGPKQLPITSPSSHLQMISMISSHLFAVSSFPPASHPINCLHVLPKKDLGLDGLNKILILETFFGVQKLHVQGAHVSIFTSRHFITIHHHLSFYHHIIHIIFASQPPKQIIYTTICRFKKNNYNTFFFEASICLLESSPSTDALCDLLLAQLRDDAASNDDADRMAGASAWARLAALVYHYVPPRWECDGMWVGWRASWKFKIFYDWMLDIWYIIDSLVKSLKIENKIYDIFICHNYIHHHRVISRVPLWESSRKTWQFCGHGQWVKNHG